MIKLRNIDFSFKSKYGITEVFENFSVDFYVNKITVILGSSGCGKTTLLNLIGGLLQPNEGSISREITDQSIGYVFQTPSLIPWLTIMDNILIGPDIKGKIPPEIRNKAEKLLNEYDLHNYSLSYPRDLSGGMQQRVSIIRAVLSGAKILLLDEPFSSIDYLMRHKLQNDLIKICHQEKLTAVFVTHDLGEAIRMADHIIILSKKPAEIKGKIDISVNWKDRIQDNQFEKRLSKYVKIIKNYFEH